MDYFRNIAIAVIVVAFARPAEGQSAELAPLRPSVAVPALWSAEEAPAVKWLSAGEPVFDGFIVGGAVIGALAGAGAYAWEVASLGDGDYLFPLSLAVFMGVGAVIGGATGWLVSAIW